MSSAAEKVIASLNSYGIPFEVINIDPQYSDTTLFCQNYHFPPQQTCNTIIVAAKKGEKKYAACVVLSHTRLDVNNRVRKLLGVAKASFASATEMMEITGMEVGGV